MSLKRTVFLFLVCLALPLTVRAQSETEKSAPCGDVDLNAAPDSPFRKIPVEDQDGTGTCYAYAASSIANYWHLKNGGSPETGAHPLYLSHLYSKTQSRQHTEGGNTYSSLQLLRDQGNCPNQKVEELLRKWSIQGLTYAEVLSLIETANRENLRTSRGAVRDWIDHKLAERGTNTQEDTSCSLNQSVSSLLRSLPTLSSNKLLQDLFNLCKPPQPMNPGLPDLNLTVDGTDADLNRVLENSLKQGFPPNINLCSKMLRDTSYQGLKPGLERSIQNDKECGNHAVVLTGIKRLKGECRYLIRNSWGADWRAKNQDCACYRRDGKYEEICSDYSEAKEVVGCWFPRQQALRNIYSASSL